MFKFPVIISTLLLTTSSFAQVTVPSSVESDPYSPVATKWLKVNKRVAQCAQDVVTRINRDYPDESISAGAYGEFIARCAKYPAANPKKPMRGDVLDYAWEAKPNTRADAQARRAGKDWRDENGYVHFPDGSLSGGPVD